MGFWSRLFGKKEEVKPEVKEEPKVVAEVKVEEPVVEMKLEPVPIKKAPAKKAAPKTKATTAKGKPAPAGVETEAVVVNKPPRVEKDIVVTEERLGKMSKKDLDEFAEALDIKLDRRERKQVMIEKFLKEWRARNKK